MVASSPGQTFLLALFVDDLLTAGGLSLGVLSLVYGVATVASALVSQALGRASDRLSLRILWLLVTAGLTLACVLAGLAHGAALVLVALVLLRSFGQGCFPLLATLIIARGTDRPGRGMAIAGLGMAAAIIVLPPLVVLSLDSIGWRETFLLCAGVVIVLTPLARLAPSPGRRLTRQTSPSARHSRESRTTVPIPPLRERLLALYVVAVPALVVTGLVLNAVALLERQGGSASTAAAALSTMGATGAAATLALGAVSDRLSVRAHLTATAVFLLAGSALLLLSSTAAAFAGFAVLGVCGSVWHITGGITWARTYGTARIGRLQGAAHSATIGAAALGPLPLAFSVELGAGLTAGVAALVALSTLALFAAIAWRPPPPQAIIDDTAPRTRPVLASGGTPRGHAP